MATIQEEKDKICQYYHMPVPEGKRDKQEVLVAMMPQALCFILLHLSQGHRVLVHCNQGMDRSVGIVAAACALFVNRKGHVLHGLHEWCKRATWESLGEKRRGMLLGGSGGSGERNQGPLGSRAALFEWLNGLVEESGGGVNGGGATQKRVDKNTLRSTLVAVSRYRHVASPSRYTMRKLSRFFTEHRS
jgi:hypothetical protein